MKFKPGTSPFWDRVQQILMAKKMTPIELSRLSSVSPQVISKGMAHKSTPQVDTAFSIADALQVSLRTLLVNEDPSLDIQLEEAFSDIRQSPRQTFIAKALPYLESGQLAVFEANLQTWGVYEILANLEKVAK